jgi:hypothetical protein
MITDLLLDVPWPLTLLVLSAAILAVIHFARAILLKRIPNDALRQAHEVSAIVYANIGVVYAIVVGLMAVHGQERWIELKETSERESAHIIAVGRSAQALNSPQGEMIAQRASAYALAVARTEWDDDREGPSAEGRHAMISLWDAVHAMEAGTDGSKPASQTVLTCVNDLMQNRMSRISLMRDHIGPLLWTVLLGGGILLIGFVLFFDPRTNLLHTALAATLTISVVSVLLLIFMYEHPTDGVLSLTPEAYTLASEILLETL